MSKIMTPEQKTAQRRKNQRGASAIEFAILAPVFLALMFSILEVGWVSFAEGVSERASSNAARLIRTGQIQRIDTSEDPEAQRQAVFDEICKFAIIFGNCEDTVTVEVITYASFKDLAADTSEVVCKNSAQDAQDNARFNPGTDDSITRIRTCVLYNTFNPAVGITLAASNGAPNRLIAQFLHRNEPFSRNIRNRR